jgi:hypothetical protein
MDIDVHFIVSLLWDRSICSDRRIAWATAPPQWRPWRHVIMW